MSAALQVALLRAHMVARRDINRAIRILVEARVSFEAAVRFVLRALGKTA